MFTHNVRKFIDDCLVGHVPFAVYMFPDDCKVNAVASATSHGEYGRDGSFFINDFHNTFQPPLVINPDIDVDMADGTSPQVPMVEPWAISTSRDSYSGNLQRLIDSLKASGGKTVYSRTICGDGRGIAWSGVADSYFEAFPSTFRYIYYTPETGAWLGASPELLLRRAAGSDVVETMALAGTRSDESRCGWDNKNIKEHDFVTKYISDTLARIGDSVVTGESHDVAYGAIRHLCHRISAHYGGDFIEALNALSPTPALAGFPVSEAMENIERYESHRRGCYGGYVGVTDTSGEYAYVNLRSVNFSGSRYCIYAGGGITEDSDTASEWDETERKVAVLRELINQNLSNERQF